MSAVSQLERDLLKMRQAEGIVIAKKKGIYKGRPKTYTERNPRLEHALELIETGNKTIKEVARITSISESTLYRAMRKNREN
jgi:DNA invertase Pin-like site-specific DNA recombinase